MGYLHLAVCLAACWSCDVFHSLKNCQLSDSRVSNDLATHEGIWIFQSRVAVRTYRATGPQNIVNEGKLRSKIRGYSKGLPLS